MNRHQISHLNIDLGVSVSARSRLPRGRGHRARIVHQLCCFVTTERSAGLFAAAFICGGGGVWSGAY